MTCDFTSELLLPVTCAAAKSNCELRLEIYTKIGNFFEQTEIKIRNYLITEIRIWTQIIVRENWNKN